jgi:hypothetical protein
MIFDLGKNSIKLANLALFLAFTAAQAFAAEMPPQTQTIVFVRHGEKQAGGLGQLECQGLNRSLALPAVIAKKFDKPLAIFAPTPARQRDDNGKSYNYIRPLATIEPTAIALRMPVNTDYKASDTRGLEAELKRSSLANGTVLVAWEHRLIVQIVLDIVAAHGGNASAVPKWKGDDFDSIYVVRIVSGATKTVSFEQDQEGLNGQSEIGPGR